MTDAAGQRTSLACPSGLQLGGRRTEYRYDSSGRLTEETGDGRRRVVDYGFGRPTVITRTGPGEQERIGAVYNGDGLLTSLTLTATREHRDEERAASATTRSGCRNTPSAPGRTGTARARRSCRGSATEANWPSAR
jgi:hypothetical protein